jgi:ribosomal protein L1
MNIRRLAAPAAISFVVAVMTPGLRAADQWIEVKAPLRCHVERRPVEREVGGVAARTSPERDRGVVALAEARKAAADALDSCLAEALLLDREGKREDATAAFACAVEYAAFGDVSAILGSCEPMPNVVRAITLEPGEPNHRLTAARVLWRQQK